MSPKRKKFWVSGIAVCTFLIALTCMYFDFGIKRIPASPDVSNGAWLSLSGKGINIFGNREGIWMLRFEYHGARCIVVNDDIRDSVDLSCNFSQVGPDLIPITTGFVDLPAKDARFMVINTHAFPCIVVHIDGDGIAVSCYDK